MVAAASLIHSSVLVAGAAVSVRLLTRKPQPVEQMVAELDLALAAKLAIIASSEDSFNDAEWRKLSKRHLHRQAVLLTRIAIELSKQHPAEFANIPAEQKSNLALIRCAAFMCLWHELRSRTFACRVNAVECARCFLCMFDVTEMLIVRSNPQDAICV
jgi:hypothetical protein